MQAMILTAGKGTRLKPYSDILPKPAIPLLNVPLVCYGLELLRPLQPNIVIANLHHLPEKMSHTLNSLNLPCAELILSDETDQILGGGGGLERARKYLDPESVFLINGDEVLIPEDPEILLKVWEHHHKAKNLATLLCIEHDKVGTQFGGVWIDTELNVHGFGKTPPEAPILLRGLHNVGYLLLSPKIFDYIPKDQPSNILYDALTAAIGAGQRVQAFTHQALWYETGNPEDYLKTTEKLLSLAWVPYVQSLIQRWGGEQDLLQSGKLLVHKSAQVPNDLKVIDFSVIGADCLIPAGTTLKRSVIGPGVQLPPGQTIENKLVLA